MADNIFLLFVNGHFSHDAMSQGLDGLVNAPAIVDYLVAEVLLQPLDIVAQDTHFLRKIE